MQELNDLLDGLEEVAKVRERSSVADVSDCLGRDAFGPVLLALGLLALSPIGDIPGLPTVMSVFVVLVGVQLAIGREGFWLPRFLLKRSIKSSRLRQAVSFLRPGVRVAGKVIRPRLTPLVAGTGARAIGGVCAVLALTLPPLEFVPFAATGPSAAITAFSLALVAREASWPS